MRRPRVSIVLPCYQNRRFIERTVDSALAQTFSDFELIIADHESDDGTWEIVQQYAADPRVRLLRTPAGGGAERNWNRATEQAQGEYLKLLCGDDVLQPACLQRQVEALDEHPTAGVVAVRRDLIDVADRPLLRGRGLAGLDGLVTGTDALRTLVRAGTNLLGEPACVLLRTELVRKVGGWSAAFPYLIDQYLYMRVLQHCDLVAINETLAAFRVSNTQWSVHLAAEQGRQATALHRRFRAEAPAVISRSDEVVGSLRAVRMAWGRRAAYFVWKKRMADAEG